MGGGDIRVERDRRDHLQIRGFRHAEIAPREFQGAVVVVQKRVREGLGAAGRDLGDGAGRQHVESPEVAHGRGLDEGVPVHSVGEFRQASGIRVKGDTEPGVFQYGQGFGECGPGWRSRSQNREDEERGA